MFKVSLFVLVVLSGSLYAFGEPMIELSSEQKTIKSLESIFVVGKISDVAKFKPVQLTVLAPDGEVVFSPNLSIDENGEFKRLIHPPLPNFKEGVYTVIASHPDLKSTAKIQFTVLGKPLPPKIPDKTPDGEFPEEADEVITISTADTVMGENKIILTGNTTTTETDITFTVNSPSGNLVTVAQITPDDAGRFSAEIVTGGPLWTENGMYSITAHQGAFSEYKNSIQVEINKGVVVPEYGGMAILVLITAITALIIVSTKTRLSIIPKY